ncbi:hypothetical protein Tco_0402386, partial [Tanacetum coccineum]
EKKGEEKNKKEKKRLEKKRKKEQKMAKEDIVFVFGRKEDIGFKEIYSAPRSKVGRKALRDAVYLIFDNTLVVVPDG